MRRFLFLGLAVLALTTPAVAQQTVKFDPKATVDCMKRQKNKALRDSCIGESAKQCFNRFKPKTTGDVAACMAAETGYWTKRMNKAYAQMMDKAADADAAFEKTAKAKKVPFKLTEDLALMQQNWSQWRETRCAVEAMMRRGTPFTSTAAASCTMKLTARQALFLESAVAY